MTTHCFIAKNNDDYIRLAAFVCSLQNVDSAFFPEQKTIVAGVSDHFSTDGEIEMTTIVTHISTKNLNVEILSIKEYTAQDAIDYKPATIHELAPIILKMSKELNRLEGRIEGFEAVISDKDKDYSALRKRYVDQITEIAEIKQSMKAMHTLMGRLCN